MSKLDQLAERVAAEDGETVEINRLFLLELIAEATREYGTAREQRPPWRIGETFPATFRCSTQMPGRTWCGQEPWNLTLRWIDHGGSLGVVPGPVDDSLAACPSCGETGFPVSETLDLVRQRRAPESTKEV